MSIRIDKYAWCVRLSKTRSIATDLVQKGKIKLNGTQVKPSRDVKEGDVLQVIKNTAIFEYKIKDLLDRRVGAKLVTNYLIDVTKPEEIEKYKTYALSQATYRNYGTGRPSKHDRKDINEFLLWEDESEEENLA
jgi:ribosome-associated heat shock protein Hsp15